MKTEKQRVHQMATQHVHVLNGESRPQSLHPRALDLHAFRFPSIGFLSFTCFWPKCNRYLSILEPLPTNFDLYPPLVSCHQTCSHPSSSIQLCIYEKHRLDFGLSNLHHTRLFISTSLLEIYLHRSHVGPHARSGSG